jgi:uncharacterized membrane protein YkvA (DUF1232 family)
VEFYFDPVSVYNQRNQTIQRKPMVPKAQRFTQWKEKVRQLKTNTYALVLAYGDSRVPWYARLFAALVAAYALSPIDLIPDFIPILGVVDDLILLPLGISLALKMIPPEVMADCRERAAAEFAQNKPIGWVAAAAIILLWLLALGGCVLLVMEWFSS